MKNIPFIFVILFYSLSIAFSQEVTQTFGQISLKDFDYQYDKDPDAEAIVLFDIGSVKFIENARNGGFNIELVRQKRILINKKTGLLHADIAIPYYVGGFGKTESVKEIKANTFYLANGSLQKKSLKKEDIFTEKTTENWHQKKFALPNAIEGAIIEYSYTLNSPFVFELPDWEFQSNIPTLYSSYTFSLIPFYEYVFLLQGTNKFDSFKSTEAKGFKRHFAGVSFHDVVYTAVMKDVPAFKDESYITSKGDYIVKIDFQLAGVNNPDGTKREIITTYPKLIKHLNQSDKFGKYLKRAEKEAKNIINNSLSLSGKTDLQKAADIINYIKENFDWDRMDRKYAQHSPKEVIKQKKGSSAEINLLLVALLKKASIEANPVIFSTRSHGKVHKDYPFDHQFNSVIVFVEIEGKKFLTDGTEPYTPFDRIPVRCMNDQGLVIKDGPEMWVNMYSNIESKSTRRITLIPDPITKKIKAEIANSFSEVEGFLYRNYYENDTKKIKKALLEEGFENISNIETKHFNEKEKIYKINYLLETQMDHFDDKLIVPPFLNYPLDENLLKQKERTYPVDFIYKKANNYGGEIRIPEGYTVTELPENLIINDDLIRIIYKIDQKDQSLKITGSVAYKKAIYQPADYAKIKDHLDTIVEKFNEPIVLEKI